MNRIDRAVPGDASVPPTIARILNKFTVPMAVLILILVMIGEVALSTRQESPSWDEGDHIYAGYMNWKNGEYDLNPEHPPLVKLVATLPLVPLDLKTAPRHGTYFKGEAYGGGRELIFRNDPKYGGKYSADDLLFRVHMASLVFGLTLAVLLFAAGKEMFGVTAGLIGMALFVFDPSFVAHAPFVATDVGASCGFFAAIYTFYRFAKSMSWQRAALCGLVTGLALTTKHSTLALAPLFLLLALAELGLRWRTARRFPGSDMARMALGLLVIGAVALTALWGVYSFRYTMHAEGVFLPTLADATRSLPAPMRGFIQFCWQYHLLPQSYLFGLADVQDVGGYWPTFIFGKIYTHGQWFYFPALFSAKWTLGTLALLALAIGVYATGKVRHWRELLFLGIPALFYLAVSMACPLNIGIRHVLPMVPFVFALIAAAAAWLAQRRKAWAWVVGALLVAHAADSVRSFPHYVPYANALWGGPENSHRYFSDSAADWAEQLKWTKEWVDRHQVKECAFAYFAAPVLMPSDYGIPCQLLPTFDTQWGGQIEVAPVVHGPILISVSDLSGYEFGTWVRNPYHRLFVREPDEVIADSIAVYYGDQALPEAEALAHIDRAYAQLRTNPKEALREAKIATALDPNGFDANRALGNALAATGDLDGARAAFTVALRRTTGMEPGAEAHWKPIVEQRLANLAQSH
ncbi:MAG: glycosyltransferase family 39 protein [Terracidiphilus sp.]|jgi:hypothetical protein